MKAAKAGRQFIALANGLRTTLLNPAQSLGGYLVRNRRKVAALEMP